MMRSLSSAVAGLRTHQTKMDVIGNNIANVNTYGYKASRVTFADVYYQTISGGSSPMGGANIRGGVNATQIGYGSQVATIDMMTGVTGGSTTNRAMDIYLTGEGYITTKRGDEIFYTRLGNLSFDSAGNLVDHTGNIVQGFPIVLSGGTMPATIPNPLFDTAFRRMYEGMVGADGLTGILNALGNSPDPAVDTDDRFYDIPGDNTTFNPGKFADAVEAWKGSVQGFWNVLNTAYNDLNTDNDIFKGATGVVNLSDIRTEMQNLRDAILGTTSPPAVGILGTPLDDIPPTALIADAQAAVQTLANLFDAQGYLDISMSVVPDPSLPAAQQIRDPDAPLRSELAPNVSLNELNPESVIQNITLGRDVEALSLLSNINIGPDGRITGLLTRDFFSEEHNRQFFANEVYTIGQIALVNFANPEGLMQAGNSYYTVGANSGEPMYSVPGFNGLGQTRSGMLEMSNVDIAQEFTDMITTQRGFQANTRVITVSDEMLAELVNLKR